MDQTITNVSQLQKALSMLNTKPQTNPTDIKPTIDNSNGQHHTDNNSNSIPAIASVSNSKTRTSADQYSSNQLLYNIAGLTTTTNNKLDMLTDATLRMNTILECMYKEQVKQTELLSSISRNTINMYQGSPASGPGTPKLAKGLVKDYGFNNPIDIAAELLIKVLKEVEIQVKHRGILYRSSRTLTRQMMSKAISTVCGSDYKLNGIQYKALTLPQNKESATVHVARRVGSDNGTNPVLTAQAIRELFDDPECRTFMAAIEDIVERLRSIRIVLPYYEADIINAISYPYFDKDGKVICDWQLLTGRSETDDEAKVITLKSNTRENLGKLLLKGVPLRSALSAVAKL